jgi:ActR/RegA family two-component response regulator
MKKVTAAIPGKGYRDTAAANKMRSGLQTESEKKLGGLIDENKKLTKQLNETKKYKQSVTTLVEQYKSALGKYRNQLKEMATFNTNLAHVNNLLVNESLALTQDDKIKIINEFKKIDTIAESQKKYKTILTEMKGSRKTLTESIENKVSASIQPSSKQKLDEVVEKTAYENNDHINRMKQLIEYADKTRSKKIIK